MSAWDNLKLAVSQKAQGVTGDQTSPWTRVANTGSETGAAWGRFKDGFDKAGDAWKKRDDPVIGKDGKPRPPTSDEKDARTLRAINQSINAFMSILSIPQDLLNVGFANLTAPLAAITPSLPASPILTPWLGIPHTHVHPPSLIPPAPPIPLPGMGPISVGVCVKVLIGGLPAARVGDYGMNFTCGSLTPIFEVFTGSSNVFIGGKRAARMGDIGVSCKPSIAAAVAGKLAGALGKGAEALAKVGPAAEKIAKGLQVIGIAGTVVGGGIGVAAGFEEAKVEDDAAMASAKGLAAAMDAAQLASDIAALALGLMMGKDPGAPPCIGGLLAGYPTVLIGGFPMINIPNPVEAILNVLAHFKPRTAPGAQGNSGPPDE
jgi:uncharacterized Zn-binding protein involved in type VI secretion